MANRISSGKKKESKQAEADGNDYSEKLLADPATKKLLIQKLMSVPEVRQLIIKTIIEKILS